MRWVEFGVALPKKNDSAHKNHPSLDDLEKAPQGWVGTSVPAPPVACVTGPGGPRGPRGPRWYPPLPIFLFVHLDSLMHFINFYLCYPFYLVFSKTFLELCKITCQLLQDFNSGAVTLLLLQLAGAMRGPMGRPNFKQLLTVCHCLKMG